jgi:hypothetical protein
MTRAAGHVVSRLAKLTIGISCVLASIAVAMQEKRVPASLVARLLFIQSNSGL